MFDITTIVAVSVRRILLPSVTGITPHLQARSISAFENPPSGPMNRFRDKRLKIRELD